jgi:hypothetical protein
MTYVAWGYGTTVVVLGSYAVWLWWSGRRGR